MSRVARSVVLSVALLAAVAGPAVVRRTVHAGVRPSPAAAVLTLTDPTGDADLTTGDIESASVTTAADGTVRTRLVVSEWTDPTSDDWVFGATSAVWRIDTDADGTADSVVVSSGGPDGVEAGVTEPGGTVVCDAEATTSELARSYEVAFSAACLGNPVSLRFRAEFVFDDTLFGLTAQDAAPDTGWSSPVSNPAHVSPIVTVDPARLYDSRDADGKRGAGSTTEIVVVGRQGVPADATAVLLNVTAVQPTAPGFVTVHPCGSERPTTSNLNYVVGQNRPNAVLAKVGEGGAVCAFTRSEIDLVVDVNGYVPALSDVRALTPARLYDSREVGGPRPAASVTRVRVVDRAGIPPTADSVMLNVTAVDPLDRGFVTVYPCTDEIPVASNINYVAGQNSPNAVLAKVSSSGEVCLFSRSSAHLVVDVNGYVPASSTVRSLDPVRVLDTREEGPAVAAGTTRAVQVLRAPGVPDDASGVILNVTAVDPVAAGFVTVFPCGTTVPLSSNLNYQPGQNIPNAVVAKLGADSTVCLFSRSQVHLVVDVNGFVP